MADPTVNQGPMPTPADVQQSQQDNGTQMAPNTDQLQTPVAPAPQTPQVTSPAQTPAPAPVAPGTPAAAAAHQGVLGEIFQTLAGGKKKEWQQTENGPVATYRDLKPGEMAQGILAAALTGLASGYGPREKGTNPMAAAFGAGFKGNEEARDNAEKEKAAEAQKQFQNQGVAEERMLRLHADARDQQRSVQQMAEHDLLMKKTRDDIARGELNDDLQAQERDQKNILQWENLQNNNSTQVKGFDGKPLDFASPHEAMEWTLKSPENHNLAFGNKNLDTVFAIDPKTNHVTVWQKPPDFQTSEKWYGVEKNPDGTPKKDENGEMIPDKKDPLYDNNGKPAVPAGPMTRSSFEAQNTRSLDNRSKRNMEDMHALDYRMKSHEYNEAMKKDSRMNAALDHWTAANGNPDALDAKGNPIMSFADRELIGKDMVSRQQNAKATYIAGLSELDKMKLNDPKDPNIPKIQAAVDEAYDETRAVTGTMLALSRPTDAPQAAAGILRKEFSSPDGKIDVDKAMKSPLVKDYPQALKDKVKDELGKEAPPSDPAVVDAINKSAKTPDKDLAAHIAEAVKNKWMDPKVADAVLKYRKINPIAATPEVAEPAAVTMIPTLTNAVKNSNFGLGADVTAPRPLVNDPGMLSNPLK